MNYWVILYIWLGIIAIIRIWLAKEAYKEAKKRKMESLLWMILILVFGLWAFIIFLLLANRG